MSLIKTIIDQLALKTLQKNFTLKQLYDSLVIDLTNFTNVLVKKYRNLTIGGTSRSLEEDRTWVWTPSKYKLEESVTVPASYQQLTSEVINDGEITNDGEIIDIGQPFESTSSPSIKTFIAGETLGGQRVVKMKDGKAFYYNITESEIGSLLGVTNQAANINQPIQVILEGIVPNVGWLTQNTIYYAGLNGQLSASLPTPPAILQRIGIAIDANQLKLELSEPISIV